MSKESFDEFLKRGGKVTKVETPPHNPDTRSDYSAKDKVDIAKGGIAKHPSRVMFNSFVNGFFKNNNNWKYQK